MYNNHILSIVEMKKGIISVTYMMLEDSKRTLMAKLRCTKVRSISNFCLSLYFQMFFAFLGFE